MLPSHSRTAVLAAATLALAHSAAAVVVEDFEDGVADGFTVVDGNGSATDNNGAFRVVTEGANNVYSQTNGGLANGNATGGDGQGKLGSYSLAPETFGVLEASLRVRLDSTANDFGFGDAAVIFGHQDNDNYYAVIFNETAANNQVIALVGDARFVIGGSFDGNGPGTGSAAAAGVFYDLLLRHDPTAGNVSLSVDGTEVYNVTDPVFSAFATGGFGVGAVNDAASFDDIVAVNVPEPATAALFGALGLAGLRRRR